MASSSADPPSDTGHVSAKHAWSQIVRCKDETSPAKKPPQSAKADQIQTLSKEPQANRFRDQVPSMTKYCVSPSESTLNDDIASFAEARVLDEASVKEEEFVERFKTAVDFNAVAADALEVTGNKSPGSNLGDAGEATISRPPWRKPIAAAEGETNPQPVMGATSWPALTEVRNTKRSSEIRNPKSPPPKAPIQESLSQVSLHSGYGLNHQEAVKNKPSFRSTSQGIVRPAFQPIENGASFTEHPALGAHWPAEQPLKHNTHARIKGNFSANPSVDTDRVYHHRNDGGAFFHNNNNRKWRNNHRDQGRGWHHYGMAYENAGNMVQLLHEQRIGPRNMPRPQPFMNMNPGFYSMPQFQNNGMYLMPPGAQEFAYGTPCYPMAHPGGVIAPEPLRSTLIKQVDYYFSVENLCRDVFLRTHMDEEGFVPVSIIAQFNRIRRLSSNLLMILEALQHSAVVEVQYDKIRRRDDRGKWRLIPDQVFAVNSLEKNVSVGHSFQGESERHRDGGLGSLEITKSCSVVEPAGAEHAWTMCDGLTRAGNSKEMKNQNVNNINLSGTNLSTDLFCRDDNKEENAACTLLVDDSAGCQSFESTNLHEEPLRNPRTLVAANQESCSSHSRCLEGGARVLQAEMNGKPVRWSGPEGFWMESSPYLLQGTLEQNDMQARESTFMLKIHKDVNDHPEEDSDRELDRPIKVSHTSLGSYIAVP